MRTYAQVKSQRILFVSSRLRPELQALPVHFEKDLAADIEHVAVLIRVRICKSFAKLLRKACTLLSCNACYARAGINHLEHVLVCKLEHDLECNLECNLQCNLEGVGCF